MNTLVTVSCNVKSDSQTSPSSGKVARQNKFRYPVRTASCSALLKRKESELKLYSKKKNKNSFEVSSNPEVTESPFLPEETLGVQYGMCKPTARKPSICSFPPNYAHINSDGVPEINICDISPIIQDNPKRNTVVSNPHSPYTSPLSPVKVFASTSLLPASPIPFLTSSPTTNRYSFCGSYSTNYATVGDNLKYIEDQTHTLAPCKQSPKPTERNRPFSISPSYQSDLSDCSFFPPTSSSYKYYSPQSPSIPEESEIANMNMFTNNSYYVEGTYSTNY